MNCPVRAIQSDEIPWVPQGERVWFKPLRFDLTSGRWVNLIRMTGDGPRAVPPPSGEELQAERAEAKAAAPGVEFQGGEQA